MPVKKPVRTKKAAGKRAAPGKTRAPKAVDERATWIVAAVALLFVSVAAAAMFASRDPAPSPDAAMADTRDAAPAPAAAPMKKAAERPGADRPAGDRPAGDRPAVEPAAEPPSSSASVPGAVEVTGCVRRADSKFILKDTDGTAAPKSRSWKTGFVKKSSASLELSDSGNAAHLSDHVGQRVSVTGALIDRQMLVQSLRRVAPSCE